jgi:hypothetical protein
MPPELMKAFIATEDSRFMSIMALIRSDFPRGQRRDVLRPRLAGRQYDYSAAGA